VHEESFIAADLEDLARADVCEDGIDLIRPVRLSLPRAEVVIVIPIEKFGIDRLAYLSQATNAAERELKTEPLLFRIATEQEAVENRNCSGVENVNEIETMAETA
jgi:hypothetical protein